MDVLAIRAPETLDSDPGDTRPGPTPGFTCLEDGFNCTRRCRFSMLDDRTKGAMRTRDVAFESYLTGEEEMLPDMNCAIQAANLGPLTMNDIAHQLGLTRQGVQVIEQRALRKVYLRSHKHGVAVGDEIAAAVELREAGEP